MSATSAVGVLSAASAIGIGCAARAPATSARRAVAPSALDAYAERYVKLVLAVGRHDANYVDAYYGPPAWAEAAKAGPVPLDEIAARAAALLAELEAVAAPPDELGALRRRFLLLQTSSLAARVRLLRGETMSFDGESEALYAAHAPPVAEAEFERRQAELERLLPGPGPLADRVEAFRRGFVVPPEKLEVVLRTALDEARRRTRARVALPAGEAVALEFVKDKPWSAYNWYRGGAQSLIQVNVGLPVFMASALHIAAHEGYPGHHVYNALLEQRLVRERGWVDFSVYPLYSPQSLIAEGSATYGVEVAFPDAPAYLRDALFPLAGLDPGRADLYMRVEALADGLTYAETEAARRYLDGRLSRAQARDWLARYRLTSPERADRLLSNVDLTRTYVINYNLGRDLVASFIERRGGTTDAPDRRWALFEGLLSSPRLPPDLR